MCVCVCGKVGVCVLARGLQHLLERSGQIVARGIAEGVGEPELPGVVVGRDEGVEDRVEELHLEGHLLHPELRFALEQEPEEGGGDGPMG